MNILNNPGLLDQLAASYALGTLRGGARRRFEAMARQSATVRAAALIWQERMASVTELQASEAPSPNVWKRIENVIAAQRAAAPAAVEGPVMAHLRRALAWWRGGALVGALATAAAVLVSVNLRGELQGQEGALAQATRANADLTAQLRAKPEIRYVAVLADDKATESMLVTFDPVHNAMTLKRVGGFQEASDKSLQLWALPPGAGPQSLGVLAGGQVERMPAVENQLRQVPALAVSLEPKGGAPAGSGPTGPVLFKGALIPTT